MLGIPLSPVEWLGEGAALLITLGLLSYIVFGGWRLFRLVAYAFVGATAGFLVAIVVRDVFLHRLGWAVLRGWWPAWLALLGALLLWLQPFGSLGRRLSGLSLAALTGIAAAVLLGGAARGSVVALSRSTVQGAGAQGAAEHLVGLLVTVLVLAAFHFQQPKARFLRLVDRRLGDAGRVLVGLALAAVFVAVLHTALWVFAERIVALGRLVHFIIYGG